MFLARCVLAMPGDLNGPLKRCNNNIGRGSTKLGMQRLHFVLPCSHSVSVILHSCVPCWQKCQQEMRLISRYLFRIQYSEAFFYLVLQCKQSELVAGVEASAEQLEVG